MTWKLENIEKQPDGSFRAKSNQKLGGNTQLIKYDMERVLSISRTFKIKVRFEDARLRKVFGETGREVLQGAGSIDFLYNGFAI